MTQTPTGVAVPGYRTPLDLFLISFLILFLELASIRWFGSTVVFLTFFTNIVLLATFLGMSVGCLTTSNPRRLIHAVIPLLLIAMTLAYAVLIVYTHFGSVMIDVGGQGSPQQVYFGTEYRARDVSRFVVPIEVVGAAFFTLVALLFVGLGQVMGRALNAMPNRVMAYTLNIAGSLAGIAAFALLSVLRTPPVVWFGIALVITLSFVSQHRLRQTAAAIAVLVIVLIGGWYDSPKTLWSPYYKIGYTPNSGTISTNNIGHQRMNDVTQEGPAYSLPYLLNRDSGGKEFDDVLVIGAGSGNDVAAALRQGAHHVDAVEIDPVINALGRANHPNHPFADPRVAVYIDDGRSFLRRTDHRYDLIVYALVDSLVLHSGYSTLRLESFLFTQEAFENIKARLKPGGVFAAYNFYRQGWLVGRLKTLMTNVFGSEPIVMAFPYRARFSPGDPVNQITFILDGVSSPTLARIQDQFRDRSFWISKTPALNDPINGFSAQPPVPAAAWQQIAPAQVDVRPSERLPEDDWPFLYLRDPIVPAVNIRSMIMIAVLSLSILFTFAPRGRVRPNWQMFFMGAGFMLLETKGVVHLALLFGSTWAVNSIVFFAILVMILCSNVFVLIVKPVRPGPAYLLLAASLLVGILVRMNAFLNLPPATRVVVSCAVVFVPIFFAGIVFATVFRDSRLADLDFASNTAGAILGGLSESLSLVIGFNKLLVLTLLFYGLAAVLALRARVGVTVPAVG